MNSTQDDSTESQLADLRYEERAWMALSMFTLFLTLYLGYVAADGAGQGNLLQALAGAATASFCLVFTARWLIMLGLTLRDIRDLRKEGS